MACEFKVTRRVEFSDTDMAGIVHFANYFRYVEAAEHAFFRSLGLSVFMELGGKVVTFPRVRLECDYLSPLKFEDEVEIHLLVREKKAKSLRYEFILRKLGDGARDAARGALTVVCVHVDESTGRMQAMDIPPDIAEKIEPAPAA